jgi:hypothetical protein
LLIGIDRNMEPEFKVKIPVPCEVKIPVPWGHVSGKFSAINVLPTEAKQVSSVVGQFVYSWVFSSLLSCLSVWLPSQYLDCHVLHFTIHYSALRYPLPLMYP